MILEGIDGKDHINIYSKGNTKLGRWLSNFTYSPIHIENEGNFNSIEGYWYYTTTGDDHLRLLSGYSAKQYGKKLPEINEFDRSKIKNAITIKLNTYQGPSYFLCNKTNLPLCHYYVYGGKKVDAGYEWIIKHIEEYRKINKL